MTMTTARTLPLRPYQLEALAAIHDARQRGVRKQLVVLPTGAGKTHVATYLVAALPGWRVLFVVHRDELVLQTVRSMTQINPDLRVGVVKADQNDVTADIVVASAQTLAMGTRRQQLVEALRRDGSPILHVEDEAHHAKAPTRLATIEAVGAELLLGLTATPDRGDRQDLDDVFEEIVYDAPMLDLIRQGYLARLRGLLVQTTTDLDSVSRRGGDFADGELARVVDSEERNRFIVETYEEHAADRVRTVAFTAGVAHAENLRDEFRSAGYSSEMISGGTPQDERREILRRFHEGEISVLANCQVLTEGFDEPAIDCILMARPTQARGFYQQMVGRGARIADDKEDCLVIDFADSLTKHKLQVLPSLTNPKSDGFLPAELPNILGNYSDSYDLLEWFEDFQKREQERVVVKTTVDPFHRRALLWRGVDGLSVARISDRHWVALVDRADGFVPVRFDKRGNTEDLFERPVDHETARGIAQEYAEPSPLVSKNATWRTRQDPASERQVAFAKSLGLRLPTSPDKATVSGMIDDALALQGLRNAGMGDGTTEAPLPEPQRQGYEGPPFLRLVEFLDAAHGRGLSFPKIRLQLSSGDRLVLARSGERSKQPGSINLTDGGRFGENAWYGRIGRDGKLFLRDNAPVGTTAALEAIRDNPEAAARISGRRTDSCSFCGKLLVEEGSVDVGYGPVCASNWGLPHPQNA